VHYGRAAAIVERRQQVLLDFFEAHPERFVTGPPKPPEIPLAAWINPPATKNTRQIGSGATFEASDNLEVPPICITYRDHVGPASDDTVLCEQHIQAGIHENPGAAIVHRTPDATDVTHVDTQKLAH